MRLLEQRRAEYAWQRIDATKKELGDGAKDVAMHLRGMPAMVLANGLGQSLGFMLAKAKGNPKDPHYVVYDIIAEWLVERRSIYAGQRRDLIQSIMAGDRAVYQQAQEETWALLVWLKKFGDAYIGNDTGAAGGERAGRR